MNCREFEEIVNDLVRAQSGLRPIDAAFRATGVAHAEICGRCASRLADERALSAGLKSLAASDEEKAAQASVEASLLEAFRAQRSNRFARRLRVRSRSWPRWVLAAAAAILVAFGLIVYRAIQKEAQKDNKALTEKTPAPQPVVKRKERIAKEIVEPEPPHESRAPRPRRGNRPRLNRPFIIDSTTTYANDSEYATDFFPLSYGGDQTPMESGEVIRVQMPRSALIRFGLPVNVERADVPVTADLLIGEDGLARAIRFVR
ncbi:MAG TPA: hypothetical protein VFV58_08345 [Blastocatellia bacterium]|jgi:hypothetical protein|nr:hypothetical protein [Blastocatellia bacterium]